MEQVGGDKKEARAYIEPEIPLGEISRIWFKVLNESTDLGAYRMYIGATKEITSKVDLGTSWLGFLPHDWSMHLFEGNIENNKTWKKYFQYEGENVGAGVGDIVEVQVDRI